MAVRTVNGIDYAYANSPVSASPIKVPKSVFFDAKTLFLDGTSGTSFYAMFQSYAPMYPELIKGTKDDYVLNCSGFPY